MSVAVQAQEVKPSFIYYLRPGGTSNLRCSFWQNGQAASIACLGHNLTAPNYNRGQMLQFITQLYNISYMALRHGPPGQPSFWGWSSAAMALIDQARAAAP